jgi:hypothetical protein
LNGFAGSMANSPGAPSNPFWIGRSFIRQSCLRTAFAQGSPAPPKDWSPRMSARSRFVCSSLGRPRRRGLALRQRPCSRWDARADSPARQVPVGWSKAHSPALRAARCMTQHATQLAAASDQNAAPRPGAPRIVPISARHTRCEQRGRRSTNSRSVAQRRGAAPRYLQ